MRANKILFFVCRRNCVIGGKIFLLNESMDRLDATRFHFKRWDFKDCVPQYVQKIFMYKKLCSRLLLIYFFSRVWNRFFFHKNISYRHLYCSKQLASNFLKISTSSSSENKCIYIYILKYNTLIFWFIKLY